MNKNTCHAVRRETRGGKIDKQFICFTRFVLSKDDLLIDTESFGKSYSLHKK